MKKDILLKKVIVTTREKSISFVNLQRILIGKPVIVKGIEPWVKEEAIKKLSSHLKQNAQRLYGGTGYRLILNGYKHFKRIEILPDNRSITPDIVFRDWINEI